MKQTESKHAAATSRSHEHAAMATSDRRPHFTAEHGLEHVDSLRGAYSTDCIAVTCYNIQVTSYRTLV
jgi:hypothetical protein